MELINIDTLIRVYFEWRGSEDTRRISVQKTPGEIGEMVEYCKCVGFYLDSVNSNDLEFYKAMIKHDNFLDRMVTFFYILDNLSKFNFNFRDCIDDYEPDYILIVHLIKLNRDFAFPNLDVDIQEAYYNVFKREILIKKREELLNQIL